MLDLRVFKESFSFAHAFTISRGTKTLADVIRVEVQEGGVTGQGECVPYPRYGETPQTVTDQINSLPKQFDRDTLQKLLAPGAARNAVDCALWDLEAKRVEKPAWQIAGLSSPQELTTAYTISLDTPEAMLERTKANAHRPLLKLKLGGTDDLARLEAVRKGAPNAQIIVDANEGWDEPTWLALQPDIRDLGVALVEQPLPRNNDHCLGDHPHLVPVCADESCHAREGLEDLRGKYDFINIKLDKTGGLTEAFAMKEAALQLNFGIMVGCMVGTSLSMAPALLVAQGVKFVDLDGPLLLSQDRTEGLRYDGSVVYPPTAGLWG